MVSLLSCTTFRIAGRIAGATLRCAFDGQPQHHARADAFDRGDGYFAAVGFDDLADDVEAEAGAAAAAEGLVLRLLVLLPDLLELLRLDAHSAVGDRDDDRVGGLLV